MHSFSAKAPISKASDTSSSAYEAKPTPLLPGVGLVQAKRRPHFNGGNIDLWPTSFPEPGGSVPNSTPLPSAVKQTQEASSGVTLDDVRVFRNSPQPGKIGAHAYTQGRDIHLGPGQDRHLAHESWHAVQQKQGRVAATHSFFGIPVNDQASLEREADQAAINPSTISSEPTNSMATSAETSAEGIVQGVFMKRDGETAYTKKELDAVVKAYSFSKPQITELWKIHGYKSWRYLDAWLIKHAFKAYEKPAPGIGEKKRNRDEESSEEDDDVLSDEDVNPSTSTKKLPKKRKKKGHNFKDNLGFQVVDEQNITKRKYFPSLSLELQPPEIQDKTKKKKKTKPKSTSVSFNPFLADLQDLSTKSGFRGNVATAKFFLTYLPKGSKKTKIEELELEDIGNVFKSSDQLGSSKSVKEKKRLGILAMQEKYGFEGGTSFGSVLHSERNMVLEFDQKEIDEKIIDAIYDFAEEDDLLLNVTLMLYSDPNEVCSACDTALYALTQADNIQAIGQELEDLDFLVSKDFSLQVITNVKKLQAVRKYNDPFTGPTNKLPPVMHSHLKK